ncbi:right-handed parallel beta-helix repeat-containing protein [Paenibacillus chungangensis]|uniref:Glycosyl hydrolase family 28-related protein n=1 Tax=Paenibacillus chungangensis TaxID=696535 RepID=A0ABW3HL10_9BACL
MSNEKSVELEEQQNVERPHHQEEPLTGQKGFISRRKLLASIGMAGVALATTGIMNGALTKAYAGPDENRKKVKVKNLMSTSMVALTTIAQLRASTQPEADVYMITDPGHEGHFAYDASDTSTLDNTGTVLVTAGGQRFKRIPETEFVSVTWFGAKGDGTTDDSAAILAANAYAASVHSALCFPHGTYRGSNLKPTTSWYSFENAVIRSNASVQQSVFHGDFVLVEDQSNLVFEGLTFDGNVSADPTTWSNATYNAFSGSVAFYLLNANHIKLKKCTFQNTFFSTIRMVGCHAIDVESCVMRKARGNFGDTVYVQASYDVKFDRCFAEDYTRIGYVTEKGAYNVSFSQCYAKNGHHSSRNYGGVESNAGFWSEQSQSISFSQCVAEDNSNRGFVCVTMHAPGPARDERPTLVSSFMLDSCLSINNTDYAFVLNGSDTPISVTCSNCFAYGSNYAFHITGKDDLDAFHFNNCVAHLSFADAAKPYVNFIIYNGGADAQRTPVVNIKNCSTVLGDGDRSSLYSTSSHSGDIVYLNAASAMITVDHFTNVSQPEHVVVKGFSGAVTLRIANSDISVPFLNSFTEVQFKSCTFGSSPHLLGNASVQGPISLRDCSVQGALALTTAGRVTVYDSIVKLSGAEAFRVVRGSGVNSHDILTEFHGCRFEKDVAVGNYVLHIRADGTQKPKSALHHCTFYHTSGTSTSNMPFIWLEGNGSTALFAACYADDKVDSSLRIGTALSSPVGMTKITLH